MSAYADLITRSAPLVWYRLGTDGLRDSSGNGYHADSSPLGGRYYFSDSTLPGNAASLLPGDVADLASDRSNAHQAFNLGSYPAVGAALYAGTGYSVNFWARFDTTQNTIPVTLYDVASGNLTLYVQEISGTLRVGYHTAGGLAATDTAAQVVYGDTAMWTATLVKSSGALKIYKNGAQINSATVTSPAPLISPYWAYVLQNWAAATSDGAFDETSVWSRVLTATEVADLYAAGLRDMNLRPLVRERPPLYEMIDIETPSGRHYRWSDDDMRADRRPQGVSYSDVMPGGDDTFDATLPRKGDIDYSDLEPLSTLRVHDAGGGIVSTTRLEKAPRVSGDQMAITPSAVGWKASLEDTKAAQELYVDSDLTHWEGPSNQALKLYSTNTSLTGGGVVQDDTTGVPSLAQTFTGAYPAAGFLMENIYNAGGLYIGSIAYAWNKGVNNGAGVGYGWECNASTDDISTSRDLSGNLRAAGPGSGTLTTTSGNKKFGEVWFYFNNGVAGGTDGVDLSLFWSALSVYGTQGLTKRGTATASIGQGFFSSDIVGHVVGKYCPELDSSIQTSTFILTQMEFREPTTPLAIVTQANRVHLWDWYVRGKTFHYEPRGSSARRWRARVGPSKLQETGPDSQRQYNGVCVRFQDVDGTIKSVGPPGTSTTTTDARLLNSDTENPYNQLGVAHYENLDMSRTATTAVATEVGVRFLEESQYVDRSGQATLTGHVQDDKGVWHPYQHVRSGDEIAFVDAADTSYRRIVKTSKSRDNRSVDIDLDAPPQGMDAVLERLGAIIAPLGFS